MPEEKYPSKEDIDNLIDYISNNISAPFGDDIEEVAIAVLDRFYLISRGDNDPIQAARMYQRTTSESLRNTK